MKYRVLLPETSPDHRRNLWGLGEFLRAEPREVELDDGQVKALRDKGFEVESLDKPKRAIKKTEPEDDESDESAGFVGRS